MMQDAASKTWGCTDAQDTLVTSLRRDLKKDSKEDNLPVAGIKLCNCFALPMWALRSHLDHVAACEIQIVWEFHRQVQRRRGSFNQLNM